MDHIADDLRKFSRYYEEFLRTGATGANSTYTRMDQVYLSGLAAGLSAFDISYGDAIEKSDLHLDLRPPEDDALEIDDTEEPEDREESAEVIAAQAETERLMAERSQRQASSGYCRSVYRRQQRDPHNRETILGVGMLGHRSDGGRTKVGPLLYWEVDLRYDAVHQRLRVFKRSPVPEVNTLVFDAFLEHAGDIEALVRGIQALIQDGEITESVVGDVFATLVGHSNTPAALEAGSIADGHLSDWIKHLRKTGTSFWKGAVLANGPRSNAFLLKDLRALAELGEGAEDSALGSLLRRDVPPSISGGDELPYTFSETVDGKGPLYYPLPNNPAQRRAGRLAERSPILAIQGPPGTGKSQTIANLVSHLIASGKSVLVTSHQRKAVEVVTKHLSAFEEMVLSSIEGDRESASRLRTQLEAILESTDTSVADKQRGVNEGEEALAQHDREMRRLSSRYQELRTKEHEVFARVAAYSDLREVDHLHPDDAVDPADGSPVQEALTRWCSLYTTLASSYDQVAALLRPQGDETTRVLELRVATAVRDLIGLTEALMSESNQAGVFQSRDWALSATGAKQPAADLMARIEGWLSGAGREVVQNFERLGAAPLVRLNLPAWLDSARRIGDERLNEISLESGALVERFAMTDEPGPGPIQPADVARFAAAVAVLETSGGSFLRWYLDPAVRRARAVVAERMPLERANLSAALAAMNRGLARTKYQGRIQALAKHVERAIRESGDEGGAGHGIADNLLADSPEILARHLVLLTQQLRLLLESPHGHLSVLVTHALGETDADMPLNRDTLARVLDHVVAVRRELFRAKIVEAFDAEAPLSPESKAELAPILSALRAGVMLSSDERSQVEGLRDLSNHFDGFIELGDLEGDQLAGLRHTLEALRGEIRQRGTPPEWTSSLAAVFQAHRLGSLLRQSLSAEPDDITDIASQLRKGESRRLSYISEIVRRRHSLHQERGLEDNSCRQELLRLRKLLGKKTLTDSLIKLRDQIDYRALLRVVPGWVCSINDAARLFPPSAGLFDVIIIDEASQCPQTVLLPLAIRAKQLVVVGDEKQLRPSFGMFIPEAQVQALKETHEIAHHPLGLFVEGRSSLLELASFRSSKPVFLDEHFRCEPAIIHWSNDRFYRNRLKVLTHRRAGGITRPLQLRQVPDADEDRDEKVNRVEADAVVREVRRLVEHPPVPDATIGVISPFRAQADLLQGLLEREFRSDPEKLDKHEIIASTADGFQGDERDVILYSFRQGPSSTPNSIGMLERQEERFNVAFTRPRRLGISFISSPIERFPKGGVSRSWLHHTLNVQNGKFGEAGPAGTDHFDSDFERQVCGRLRDRGLTVTTQVPCGNFRIDLGLRDSDGRVLAVECDGSWKHDAFGNLKPEDYQRQDLIERAGWTVHRISGRRYLLDPVREIDRVLEVLGRQPTQAEQATLEGEGISSEAPDRAPAPAPEPMTESPPASAPGAPPRPDELTGAAAPPDGPKLPKSEIDTIVRLGRWALLQNKVRGPMFDRIVEIMDHLREEGSLSESDHRALGVLADLAQKEGFDPSKDLLP